MLRRWTAAYAAAAAADAAAAINQYTD